LSPRREAPKKDCPSPALLSELRIRQQALPRFESRLDVDSFLFCPDHQNRGSSAEFCRYGVAKRALGALHSVGQMLPFELSPTVKFLLGYVR
jgi:hypothetical protein